MDATLPNLCWIAHKVFDVFGMENNKLFVNTLLDQSEKGLPSRGLVTEPSSNSVKSSRHFEPTMNRQLAGWAPFPTPKLCREFLPQYQGQVERSPEIVQWDLPPPGYYLKYVFLIFIDTALCTLDWRLPLNHLKGRSMTLDEPSFQAFWADSVQALWINSIPFESNKIEVRFGDFSELVG